MIYVTHQGGGGADDGGIARQGNGKLNNVRVRAV